MSAPPEWPEWQALRALAAADPAACKLAPSVGHTRFVDELRRDYGLTLPAELLALYAVCDGFDLTWTRAGDIPVFSLLPSAAIDFANEAGAPPRATLFEGGDGVHFSVYAQGDAWRLVYERDYQPVADIAFDLAALLRFGRERLHAPSLEALFHEHSWDRFFGVKD